MDNQTTPMALGSNAGLGLVERLRQRMVPTYARNEKLAGALFQIGAEVDPLCEEAAAELERQKVRIDGLMFDALGEPRRRYVRVTLDGSHCVMHPTDGDRYVQDARDAGDNDADRYIVRDVYLSEREFDDLPEFDGF